MKVLVFPRGSSNPYQNLLYDELHSSENVHIEYLEYSVINLLMLPFILYKKYRNGYRIVHLHWPNFYVYAKVPLAKYLSFLLSWYCIRVIRWSRLRLVWTVHNVLPHQVETIDDLAIARYLAKYASAKILHSHSTVDAMKDFGMDATKCFIIPHGSYGGVYRNSLTTPQARHDLNIPPKAIVVLFFGAIKDYKGLDSLLCAFRKIKNRNAYLVIAGECRNSHLRRRIEYTATRADRIIFRPGFVADKDVPTYFKASNMVCLPFASVTTSGSALLALTFQRPLIAPALGSLKDIPKRAGFFYDPSDPDALTRSLNFAVNHPKVVNKKVENAGVFIRAMNWTVIAEHTKRVYDSVLF